MKIRGDKPFLALRVYVKMSEIHETGGQMSKVPIISGYEIFWNQFGFL
jgi:hypothetical protein